MRAHEALAQSSQRLIAGQTQRGLVTIFHQPRTENFEEGFHLRFIPCDQHGHLNASGTLAVGSYNDLDAALSAATASYEAAATAWKPTTVEELERAAPFAHAPIVDGRHITHSSYDVSHSMHGQLASMLSRNKLKAGRQEAR